MDLLATRANAGSLCKTPAMDTPAQDSPPPPPPPPRPRPAATRRPPPPPTTAPRLSPEADAARTPGWYPDPWAQSVWRWWDGATWSANENANPERSPRLPSWLSPPVLTASVPAIGYTVWALWGTPLAFFLGLLPLLIVGPALLWIDRVEPEPWTARLHALLWGAFVAGALGLFFNTLVAALADQRWAAVASAPLSEEIGKGLGIVWAWRRKEIDSVMDGLVYAGWVALGFAVIEDFSYFALAESEGVLFATFVGRALLTPFAHPLFTAWTGLAIGLAAAKKRSLFTAWWGLGLAILAHAVWNGAITFLGPDPAEAEAGEIGVGGVFLVLIVGLFFVLFLAAVIALIKIRRQQDDHLKAAIPQLADRYGLTPDEISPYRDVRTTLKARKAFTDKDARRRFDRQHLAIARLAAFHEHPGDPDPARERRLVAQLHAARLPDTAG